ncbi:hypothetical protein JCM30204_15480 [Dysgonomonas termitidis]|jgi:hypothetical protein
MSYSQFCADDINGEYLILPLNKIIIKTNMKTSAISINSTYKDSMHCISKAGLSGPNLVYLKY